MNQECKKEKCDNCGQCKRKDSIWKSIEVLSAEVDNTMKSKDFETAHDLLIGIHVLTEEMEKKGQNQ